MIDSSKDIKVIVIKLSHMTNKLKKFKCVTKLSDRDSVSADTQIKLLRSGPKKLIINKKVQ